MLPAAVAGVHRIEVRMGLDNLAHLLLRKAESIFEKPAVRFKDELNHYVRILAAGCAA